MSAMVGLCISPEVCQILFLLLECAFKSYMQGGTWLIPKKHLWVFHNSSQGRCGMIWSETCIRIWIHSVPFCRPRSCCIFQSCESSSCWHVFRLWWGASACMIWFLSLCSKFQFGCCEGWACCIFTEWGLAKLVVFGSHNHSTVACRMM